MASATRTDSMTSEAFDRLVRATRWAIADAEFARTGGEKNFEDIGAVPESSEEETPDLLPSWDQSLWAAGFVNAPVADLPHFGDDWGVQFVPITCPSSMCMAGNGAFLLGGKFVVPEHEAASWEQGDDPIQSSSVVLGEGEDVTIENVEAVGRRSFGLSSTEASLLFDGDWDITSVVSVVQAIATHHGRHLPAEIAEHANPDFVAEYTETMYD